MNKKPNFFQKVAYSFVPPKYGDICLQKSGAIAGFVFLLSFFLLLGTALNVYSVYRSFLKEVGVEDFDGLVNKYIPDFTIEDGKLKMSETIDYAYGQAIIHVDSSDDEIRMSDVEYLVKQSKYNQLVLGSGKNLVIYDATQGRYNEIRFSEMSGVISNKQDLLDQFKAGMGVIWVIAIIIVYFCMAIGYFIKALLYFLIFLLLNLFLKRKLMNGNIYEVAVYAVLPATLVDLVLTILPLSIPKEITSPLYFVMTVLLGAFGMMSVHEANIRKLEESKYQFGQNPYRVSGFVPDDSASLTDEDFGGYGAIAGGPKPTYAEANGADTKVRVKGVEIAHADLGLVDRYIKANMKDMAAEQLQIISGLSLDDCKDVVGDWNRYYF